MSVIEEIYFPASLKELKEGWCYKTDKLTNIIISPMNDRFIFKENKYLLGKSDPNIDEFDTLLFACRDIKEIYIPLSIKIISSFVFHMFEKFDKICERAFSFCLNLTSKVSKICERAFYFFLNLTKVEFSSNSNLQLIEKHAFSKINNFFIPPKVLEIYEYSFRNYPNLQIIEITYESELKSIPFSAFFEWAKVIIMIPSSLKVYYN